MRRAVWLIWLCLALLPLRGMAHAVMLGAGASHGAGLVQAAPDAAAPCPMHVAGPTGDAAAPAQDAGSPASSGCHLCGVCHGVAMPSVAVAQFQGDPPRSVPTARLSLGAGRDAPDGLFRPPR